MDARYDLIFKHTFKVEKGFQNDPDDTGNWYHKKLIGTKYGIIPSTYFRYYKKRPTVQDMRSLTLDQAKEITYHLFYLQFGCDKITDDYVAHLVMDAMFNHGAGGKVIQRACNVLGAKLQIDNAIGPNTLKATNRANPVSLYNEIKSQRLMYMMTLHNWWKYKNGWIRRICSFNYGAI